MEKINAWAMVVCICSVIACLAEMLIPDAKYEKTVRFVIGCLMICAFIDPVKELMYSGDISLSVKEYNYTADNSPVTELRKDYLKEKLTTLTQNKLDEKGLEVRILSVDTDNSGDLSTENIICNIEIPESLKDKTDDVRRTVRDVLGEKVKIIIYSLPDQRVQ